jgi:NAD(P)-dependent dehydrogenase (short-subunit alcohol dehydrogenase family)
MKSIIVTGGNAGIGKAIATELARQEHHVIIISRDPDKGQAALEEIKSVSGTPTVDLAVGDLSSVRSTKELAAQILERFPRVSVLVNNAGLWPTKLEVNPDGLEMAFMVNHMAPFILGNMLLDLLKKNGPARIVNVNAGLYVNGKVNLEKTPYGKDFGKLMTYMNTKLCNIYFTQKFAGMIEGSGVTINALHPGVIRTGLGDRPGLLGGLYKFLKRGLDSPEKGAKAPVWLAVSPEVEGVNGAFYWEFTRKPYAKNARDAALREKLWNLSMKIASL